MQVVKGHRGKGLGKMRLRGKEQVVFGPPDPLGRDTLIKVQINLTLAGSKAQKYVEMREEGK